MYKKLIKNKKAKMNIMRTLVIVAILVVALSSNLFITTIQNAEAVDAWWDSNWDHCFVINTDGSQIEGALTNFPVLVVINSTVAAQCDGNASLRFVALDNTTEYAFDIDHWDASSDSYVWVNVTTLADAGTSFFCYYGNSGASNAANEKNTWNSDYEYVYHLNETTGTGVHDSGKHSHHGTYSGSLPTAGAGVFGNEQYFDGTDDRLTVGSVCTNATEQGTMELWWDLAAGTADQWLGMIYKDADEYLRMDTGGGSVWLFNVYDQGAQSGFSTISCDTNLNHLTYTWQDNDIKMFLNGNQIYEDTSSNLNTYTPVSTWFGESWASGDDCTAYYDEIRVSKVRRTDAWIVTNYNNQKNTSTFCTFGYQQAAAGFTPSSFEIKGLTNDRVTWAGGAGSSVWCNSSGNIYETLEVNMSVNASHNVTELRVWVGDLNNTGTTAYVNASNITLYVSSDNSSFGSLSTFTDGGSNTSINSSTWNAGTMGTNPFAGAGLSNTNTSIYLRFKLSIPAAATATFFWASSATAWKIYIGYYA